MIIGLCGFIGAGKGTVAKILVNDYGFKEVSFADRLKDIVAVMFDWDRSLLEGDTKESREWRESPDDYWSSELGYEITPRLVLQKIGTDCMRRCFDNDIWILFLKKKLIDNKNQNFVIPDVRFNNEKMMIKNLNGQIWQIKKKPDPSWVDYAISDKMNNTSYMRELFPDIHESEWGWIDYPHTFDEIIKNDSDLESLKDQVHKAIARQFQNGEEYYT